MRRYRFDKQGRIMKEEVKPLATKEEVDEPKLSTRDILVQVKDLFEDLKVARSAPVKGFIFENIYKVLGSLEGAIIKMSQEKTDLAKQLAKKTAALRRNEDFHKWQIGITQKLANQERQEVSYDCEETQRLEQFRPCLSGEIDCQIPESEMRAYCNFFTHPLVYSIAPTSKLDELSCGIGKILVDKELEAEMLREAEMEMQLSAESLSVDLSSGVLSQCSCDKCDLLLEEEKEEEDHSEVIANEASAFLDKIGPAAPVDWHGLGNDPSLVVPLSKDDCCDECEMTAEEFFGEGKDDVEASK